MKYFTFVFGLFFMLMFIGCDSKTQPLKVAINTWPGYEPVVLAKEFGYIDDSTVITRADTPTDIVNALNHDIIDVGFLTFDEVIALNSRSKEKLKIIAIVDISYGGDVIIAKQDIKTMNDLKGKNIGLEPSILAKYILHRALQMKSNITVNDIHTKYFLNSEHFDVFKNNIVDAVITYEPTKTKLLTMGTNIIFDSSQMPNGILDVMVVKEKTIKTHKNELSSFVKGWFDALDYIENNKDRSIEKMAKYEDISKDEFKKAYKGIKVPTLAQNIEMLNSETPTILDSMENIENFLLENKIIKEKNKDLKELFTDIFL